MKGVKGFPKGHKYSVGKGRPSMTDEQKKLALTTRTQFKNLLVIYSTWTIKEIQDALKEKVLPVIDLCILKHLLEAAGSGAMDRIDWTNDHVMGKRKDKVADPTNDSPDNSPLNVKRLTKVELLFLKEVAEKNET